MKRFSDPVIRALLLLAVILAIGAQAAEARQFYRVEGTQIVDPSGQVAMQKGIGLGGWLMPEPYMLDWPSTGWRNMKEQVIEVIGKANADSFWREYRRRFVAEKDIAKIAEWGFDHIRLPFHYEFFYDLDSRTFVDSGFTLLDEFLGWCETYGLPVVLDMHAAPGAQSAGDIADGDGTARFWTEPVPHQDMAVEIWTEFARRYQNDTRILGYEFLNEPVTPDAIGDGDAQADALRAFYVRATNAVRAIDTNHIIFIDGNYFSTTFYKLDAWDDNMVYAFHRYWVNMDTGSIQYLLDFRNQQQRPLWFGEAGENSNPWIADMAALSRDNDFGYNFWTHKQLEATVPPTSARSNEGFEQLKRYWSGSGSKPSQVEAITALNRLAADLDMDSVRVNRGVIAALVNADYDSMREPFADHRIPGIVNAADYDLGNNGVTYSDTGIWAVSGSPGGGNNGASYRNDGVDIERSSDAQGFEYNVGWLDPQEWMEYTVTVEAAGVYDLDIRVASSPGDGNLTVYFDGVEAGTTTIPATGGWQRWVTRTIPGIHLEAGVQIMRLEVGRREGLSVVGGDFNVNRLTFSEASGTSVGQEDIPERFGVTGLFPHPVRSVAVVELESPAGGRATLSVFDLLGRQITTLQQELAAGPQRWELDLSGIASGTYLLRVENDKGVSESRSLIVTR